MMSDLLERVQAAFGAANVVSADDDEGPKEFRIFGPPGTGKTTYLTRQLNRAAEVVGPQNIMVASFTKAAAAEIAGRDTPLSDEQIGTLHSFCYRALGRPPMIDVKAWNEYAPQYALSEYAEPNIDEMAVDATYSTTGDELLAQAQLLRAKMVPVNLWPTYVQAFHRKWEDFKRETGTIDFTDMIELALRDTEAAPGEPLIGFFDEVQDFAPLELALVRKWAKRMDMVLLAGDDDQAIYGFKGAIPDAFLDPPVPENQKRVLKQSYRVPRAIQALAQAWIEKVSRREPKEYSPRDLEGEVRRIQAGNWRHPEAMIEDAQRYLEAGKTVMFLTTCAYMLEPLKATLRKQGIPFHNPYRRRRGDWNPLRPGRGTSTTERVLAFFRLHQAANPEWAPGDPDTPTWRNDDFAMWTALVKASEVFKRGAKKAFEQLPADYYLRTSQLWDVFNPGHFHMALYQDPDWLEAVLLASKAAAASFPLTVIRKHGTEALKETPQVIIGTIHSVKGGEADVVYLMPDLSQAGYQEWQAAGEQRDGVRRLFYVGMTRAKEVLVLCQPAGPLAVSFSAG